MMTRVTKRNNKQSTSCCCYNNNYLPIIIVSIFLLLLSEYNNNNIVVVVNAAIYNNRRGTVLSFISTSNNISNNNKQHYYSKKGKPTFIKKNKTRLHINERSVNDVLSFLPFFANQQNKANQAAVAKTTAEENNNNNNITPATTTTTTTRKPLGTIFDSRDYIFTTETNIRSYEWTTKQTEELFEDLYDAAFGITIVNENNDNDLSSTTTAATTTKTKDNNNDYDNNDKGSTSTTSKISSLSCYELGQIVIVPMKAWDTALYGIGQRYDIYDGQQRIVTLCLLFAALRNSLSSASDDSAETMNEITNNLLYPTKVRKESLPRIELKNRNQNKAFQNIITASDDNNNNNKNRITENYDWLSKRLTQFTKEQRIQFLDYILENVYLLVCVPESDYIARNIVLGQSKGMDNEPIDDFKGLVCFRYTQKENDMHDTFDEWDNLASDPASFNNNNNNENTNIVGTTYSLTTTTTTGGAVGRNSIATACRLRTTAALRRKIGKNQEEVKAMELWLKQTLWYQNNKKDDKSVIIDGKDFFIQQIQPASKILYMLRTNELDTVLQYCCSNEEESTTDMVSLKSRLRFLRSVLTNFAGMTKDIEMVILEALLIMKNSNFGTKEMDNYFALLELTAMEFIMMKPSPAKRLQRCFGLLDILFNAVIQNNDTNNDAPSFVTAKEELLQKEVTTTFNDDNGIETTITTSFSKSLLRWIINNDFGTTASGKRMAMALLERMNSYLILTATTTTTNLDDDDNNNYIVETIIPPKDENKRVDDDELYWIKQWKNYDRTISVPRLANLCLLTKKKLTKKQIASSFPTKQKRYQNEVLPLTNTVCNEKDWNYESFLKRQTSFEDLLHKIWGLSSASEQQQQPKRQERIDDASNSTTKKKDKKRASKSTNKKDSNTQQQLLSNIVKGTRLEYYWDDESQWCKARVTEEPTKNMNNEITVKLYFEDDKFVEEGIVLSSEEDDGTKWRII